jgi:sulfite dehydrogenase (cytochrome) subunit A
MIWNSRGFFEPRGAGGQFANGAMGNARWRGVPLKAVLDKAGIHAGSRQVTFNGLDEPVLPGTLDFIKALDTEHARDGEVMIAYAMNGEELPWLNAVQLVVPGYYGTYWVKHLNEITVIDNIYDGCWMKTAYAFPTMAAPALNRARQPPRPLPSSSSTCALSSRTWPTAPTSKPESKRS